jgi:PKD repeat protein
VVEPDGRSFTLCTGFLSIEDIILDAQGRLYISEGASSGLIIQIEPPRTAPGTVEVSGPAEALIGQNLAFTASVLPPTVTLPITYIWSVTDKNPLTVLDGPSSTAIFAWSVPGPKQIVVTAINAWGRVTGTHTATVYTPPTADFGGTPTKGIVPLAVTFVNRTSGDYVASLWSFGDGLADTANNPAHTYRSAGTYTVTLTVSGPGGSDTESRSSYITASRGLYLPLVLWSW